MNFKIETGLRPEHQNAAAVGFWTAFSGKIGPYLGPAPRATRFIESVIDPAHAISAIADEGTLLGVAGFKTKEGALVGGSLRDLARTYGPFGALWRGLVLSLLERECEDGTLLMDGIFVFKPARGLGVGTALLDAVVDHAGHKGLNSVRLDVINKNPRAMALYERLGFVATSETCVGPFRHLFGFRSATTMTRQVSPSVSA